MKGLFFTEPLPSLALSTFVVLLWQAIKLKDNKAVIPDNNNFFFIFILPPSPNLPFIIKEYKIDNAFTINILFCFLDILLFTEYPTKIFIK